MAASFSDRYTLISHPTLLARVRMAMVKTATTVAAEDPATENHTARRELASQVLRSPIPWADVFIHGVLTNANVGTGTSDPAADTADGDGALEFVIASLWDAYA